MDAQRFDRLARLLSQSPSRRRFLGALAAVLALLAPRTFGTVVARKKKKLKKNEFGCVNVGGTCRGKDANCCSGICAGKKPKKGKKDKSKCVAHNVGECHDDQDGCIETATPCGTNGTCFRTTGLASFCGLQQGMDCALCTKDTDCEALFGAGAACIVCGFFCPSTGGTACMPAAAG